MIAFYPSSYVFYHDAPVFKLTINNKMKRITNAGKEGGYEKQPGKIRCG